MRMKHIALSPLHSRARAGRVVGNTGVVCDEADISAGAGAVLPVWEDRGNAAGNRAVLLLVDEAGVLLLNHLAVADLLGAVVGRATKAAVAKAGAGRRLASTVPRARVGSAARALKRSTISSGPPSLPPHPHN